MSLTNFAATAVLKHLTGVAAYTMPSPYVGLFTAVGTDAGTGFTEVSGGSYARQAASGGSVWGAPTGSDPVTITTSLTIAFPVATANWGTVIAWGLFDAVSGGNLLEWDYLGGYTWLPCYVTAGSPCRIYAVGNNYGQNDTIVFTTKYGGQLPSFVSGNFSSPLTVISPTGSLFTPYLSGAGVNTSTEGSGNVRKIASLTVNANMPTFFFGGALSLSLQ